MKAKTAVRQQRKVRAEASAAAPPVDAQIQQLLAAGWKRINGHLWKAPVGGYFLGPYGAYRAMARVAALSDGETGATGEANKGRK